MRAVETKSPNELIIEYHRLTKQSLCIHQDDSMGCYDRIIRTHVFINSRKFSISDKIYKIHLQAHDNMTFRNQMNNNTSEIIYESTEEFTMHGMG